MASSTESLQCPLKDKLSQVKHLLSDANERLQEEASKYEIFATKTSATTTTSKKQNNAPTMAQQDVPVDLRRTINDITTIQSVLSCPVFNQIVNVTDSLSKLSFHLNLRPSIGPADINFDSNGELILKPPIESSTFNNVLSSKLDEYSDNFQHSPINLNKDLVHANGLDPNKFGDLQQQQVRLHQTVGSQFDVLNADVRTNGYLQHIETNQTRGNHANLASENLGYNDAQNRLAHCSPNSGSLPRCYDSEKLVKNGTSNISNGNKHECQDSSPVTVAYKSNNQLDDEGRRLYKPNGHFALNQMVPNNNMNLRGDSKTTRSMSQINEQFDESQSFGYSNDMYKTTHELNLTENMAIDHQLRSQTNGQGDNNYLYNIQGYTNDESLAYNNNNNTNLIKLQARQGSKQNRASPSTSAGSTVRLADECDSGTSSFRSQAAKGALYSPQPQSLKNKDQSSVEELVDSSIDQELIEKLCPEMERIKVTLEKDNNGLGITIAGYTCDEVDLSGIFIKSIAPGSPADLSGKIKLLDQIFAVNGQEILGYSNPEAVSVLRRHTGRVVTLELMRYLTESKCRKLQSLLDHATPSSSLQKTTIQSTSSAEHTNVHVDQQKPLVSSANQIQNVTASDKGILASRDTSECIYKNTSVSNKALLNTETALSSSPSESSQSDVSNAQLNMPVAAQRGGSTTNKIIETKHGARNTIDIRSPLCQTTATATYVNKIADIDFCDSANRSMAARLQQEASDEFGQLVRTDEPEWDRDVQIVELCKDSAQGLGFTVKEYANPKDQSQSIIMITSLTPGGIAERDGRLSFGDLLIFVDDTSLEGASLEETVKALKKTSGQVRLGVLKLKRV